LRDQRGLLRSTRGGEHGVGVFGCLDHLTEGDPALGAQIQETDAVGVASGFREARRRVAMASTCRPCAAKASTSAAGA
jgi:hypothetical protein